VEEEQGQSAAGSVRFAGVTLLHHDMELDGSKLPSDGLAPIGLGALQRKELRRLDSYEDERANTRTGVGHIPPEKRRQVIGVTRAASQDRMEADNSALKREHAESIREHIRDIRAQRELERVQASATGEDGEETSAIRPAAAAAAGAQSRPASSEAPASRKRPRHQDSGAA